MTLTLDALVLPAFDDLEGLPGEATPWHEQYDLSETVSLSALRAPLRHDGRVGIVPTGIGKVAAATTTATLCASDRLDLSETLICSVGVAGAPPSVPVGSVMLADTVLDWDDKLRFDGEGTEGTPPLALNPYTDEQAVFALETDLLGRTRDIARSATLRTATDEHRPPRLVGEGVNVCGDELWHGDGIAEQVEWLCERRGVGPYRVTEMEDVGTARALERFGHLERYLTVRAVSNHDRPRDSTPARAGFFEGEFEDGFPVAVENAVRVAARILEREAL